MLRAIADGSDERMDEGVFHEADVATESIERVLVSSPPTVAWEFRAEPEPGSEEARTLEILRCAREWVDSDAAAPP